jgi:hypothetical protein
VAYLGPWTMTMPWPPLVLDVVEEQGLRLGSGGFSTLAALRRSNLLSFLVNR